MNRGFTLIELLVVVTIIVVLLALLVPAMDKAIYQAEIASCGANQKGFSSASTTYAMAHKRTFAQPPGTRGGDVGYQPDLLGQRGNPNLDVRVPLAPYVASKMFNDPLAPGDVDFSIEGNDADTLVFINYYYFAGWKYVGALGGRGMLKVGDRLTFLDSRDLDSNSAPRRVTSGVMLTERHVTHQLEIDQSTHPDELGVMPATIEQNGPFGVVVLAGVGVGGGKYSFSEYQGGGNGSPTRGDLELNYGMIDGSVQRIGRQKIFDDRFSSAPAHAHSDVAPEWKIQLPRN